MAMLRGYLFAGGIFAFLSALGWGTYQKHANTALRADLVALSLNLNGCLARGGNLLEDIESDKGVDARTNTPDALRDAGSEWLFTP